MAESEERHVDIKKQYSGTTYQIKVLLLLLCRGKKIENNEHFYLRTEVKEAEKFDDALFYYRKKGETKYNVRYCQIKNSESETAELKYSDFVSDFDKAVANIRKYFISFRKIKIRSIDENVNVEDFILCTSYKMSTELKKDAKSKDDEILTFVEINTPDELFCNGFNQWKRYKIADISSELENSLMKTTNLDLLAEELIEAINKSKKQNSPTVTLDAGNFWLSIYESALKSENVIIEKSNKNGNNYFVFSEEFLKGICISKECGNFRKIFLYRCGTKFMNLFLRHKHFAADESFMNVFESKNKDSPVNDMDTDTVEKFAKQISEYIFNDKPLSGEIVCHNNFLTNVFKKVYSNTLKFNGDFVQNTNIQKATAQFKEYFLLYYTIMELKNMMIKFVGKKDTITDKFHHFSETLANNNDHEKEIQEFFEKFSVQTLPHHDELMNIIQEEIGEEFNLLEDKWVTYSLLQKVEEWFKKTVEQPLDKAEIENFYDEIKKDIVIQRAERNVYTEQLKAYNLSFETLPYTWKNFVNPSSKDKCQAHFNRILFLTTDEPILTAIKVHDVILSFDFYKKLKSFIIAPASVLLRMEITANYITNALNLSNCYNLVVIVDDNRAETITVFTRYLKTLGKKIILISTEKLSFYEMLKNDCIFHENEDNFEFNQLTSTSQEYILQKNVLFQGLSVPLSSIVNDAFHSIDSKTIMELVSNKSKLKIGKMLESYKEYDEKFYIERKIGVIKLKDKFFTKVFTNCLFLIEGKNSHEIQKYLEQKNVNKNNISISKSNTHTPFVLTDSVNAETSFRQLCDKNTNSHIYWFKLRNDNLIWFQCPPSAFDKDTKNSPLLFTETYYEDEKTAIDFLYQSRIVIITDSPGMGKSTILTNLTQRGGNNVIRWKVKIDLNKYTKYFLDIKNKKRIEKEDYEDIGKYVMDKICGRISLDANKRPFAFCIFDEMFCNDQIFFIFDGFDEISPNYETIVLDMFEKIRTSTKNYLWITSRLNMKSTLERKLKAVSFTIMPFTFEDQNAFLKKFWKSNWKNDWSQKHEHHIKIYAKDLVKKFNEMTKRNGTDIIGIPLQTKMLADVFQENDDKDHEWQSCYKFFKDTSKCDTKSCECSPALRNKLQNLYTLYEAFIKTHIFRYLNEKNEFDNSKVSWSLTDSLYYNEIHKAHKIIGMLAFSDETQLSTLLTESESISKTHWMHQIKAGHASFGLISHVSDSNKPLFTHLTFAEYFAANFLIEKLISHPTEVFELMEIILQNDIPVFVYCIKYLIKTKFSNKKLEEAMQNTTVINFISKHGFINCFKYFTMDDNFEENFPQIDKLGKTPLHYAVEFNQIKCVIFVLLQKYNRLYKSDESYDLFYQNRETRNIEDDDMWLINIQKKSRLFLLQEFILFPDRMGKNVLDYSKTPEITHILNDFIQIGEKSLVPRKATKDKFTNIQWVRSKYDFVKEVDGKESNFSMKNLVYVCSLETLNLIVDNCENLFLSEEFLSSTSGESFLTNILSRNDISENQKITFFNSFLQKLTFQNSRLQLVLTVLLTSITHNKLDVFYHFFCKENIREHPDEFNHCFAVATEAMNLKVVQFLFENVEHHLIADISKFLYPVKTNLIILKNIFEQFGANEEMQCNYAERVLLLELKDSYEDPTMDKVKFLLSKNARIHLADDDGKTAWDYATERQLDDIVKIMVPHLPESKIKNMFQRYFRSKHKKHVFNFFEAFEAEEEKICLYLIRHCKNVNIEDEKGKSLLFNACEKGWLEVTKILLKMAACYEDVFDEKRGIFEVCETNEDIVTLVKKIKSCFENFNSHSSVSDFDWTDYMNTVNKQKKPLWYIAACAGEIDTIVSNMHVLFYENSINYQYSEGNTALHLAAKGGFKDIVEYLLQHGSYYNVKNTYNRTPCDLAEDEEIVEIFKKADELFEAVNVSKKLFHARLCDDKDDVIFSIVDNFGSSLLHYSVINGFQFYVKKSFYKLRMVVNKKDINQKTPLYYAIENNDVQMVKLLFQNGAKLERNNNYRKIENNECTYIIGIIDQLFSDICSNDIEDFKEKMEVLCASSVAGITMFEILNIEDNMKKNIFEHALDINDYDLIVFLLKRGATVKYDARDCINPKIIHIVKLINKIFEYVENGGYTTASIIRLIKENQCTEILTTVRRLYCNTLLHVAVEAENFKMVKWLIENGSDKLAKNTYGETPLYLAENCSDENIINLLKKRKQAKCTNNIYSFNENKIIEMIQNVDFQQPKGNEIRKTDGTIIARHGFRDRKDWIKLWKNEINITLDSLLDIANVVDILTINVISKKMIPDVAYFNPEWWEGVNPFSRTLVYSVDEMIELYCVNLSNTTKFIFFPLLINFHWITFVYEVEREKLFYYDPIYQHYEAEHWQNYYETAKHFINKFVLIFYRKSINATQMEQLILDYRQNDESSSGLFISKYMEIIMDGGIFLESFDCNEYKNEIIELFSQLTLTSQ